MILADTTPLSVFLRIGRTDLLSSLFPAIHIPEAVAAELDRGQARIGTWREILPSIQVHRVTPSPLLQLLLTELDPGESEAIALAVELGAKLLLLDEAKGRATAQRLKLPCLGSVGVVLLAKERGLIPLAQPVLDELRGRGGLWLSDQFYQSILTKNGELGS